MRKNISHERLKLYQWIQQINSPEELAQCLKERNQISAIGL